MDNLLPRHTIINIMIVQSSDSYQRRPDFANDINFPLLRCSFPFWRFVEASYNDLTCKVSDITDEGSMWRYCRCRRHISVNLQSNILISIIMLCMRCIYIYTQNIFLLQPCHNIYMRAYRRGRVERSSGKVQDSKRSK